jgi:Ni,Fe-hydrogenase I cytochrome b subunit
MITLLAFFIAFAMVVLVAISGLNLYFLSSINDKLHDLSDHVDFLCEVVDELAEEVHEEA